MADSTMQQRLLHTALSKLSSGQLPTKSERRVAALSHPALFAWIYLKDDDGNAIRPAPIHVEWYEILLRMLRGELKFVGLQAPKSHAKSTIFSKIVPLWLTACDKNIRIITGAVNSDLADRFMRANRRELEANAMLIDDLGPFKPKIPEKWTQTELIVQRTSTSQSPTWRAVGSQKPVQGGRSDWVIGDDLADLENSMTQAGRDKLQEWFDGDLLGTLEPESGRALVVGTAKHNDDLLMRIEQKAKHGATGWFFKRYDAIVDEDAKTTLWPARWGWNALMEKKAAIGSLTFARDYRNVATNDETSLFPMWMLERAKNRDLCFAEYYGAGVGENDFVTAALDLAIIEDERQAQRADGDYTVCEVWAKADTGKRRLLWAYRKRGLGMTPQITLAESTLRRYPTLRIATVEANQAQRWFASTLLTASKGELPIRKHVTGKGVRVDVYQGIPSLQALFEANMIELPYGDERSRTFVDIFVAELHGLGVEAHDDTVLSFWLNEVGLRKNVGLHYGTLPTAPEQPEVRKRGTVLAFG